MKNKNKIKVIVIASIVAMAMAMVMLVPAAMGASDTETLRPNADGTYQEWTFFGTDLPHWNLTSDESDATGVKIIGVTTSKETENLTDPTFPDASTINSVTVYAKCTVVNGGKAPEKGVIITRTGGANYVSDAFVLSDSPAWTNHSIVYTENPGGSNWTKAQITDLEVGSRADTLGSGETMQCSEYWVVVDYTISDTTPPGNVTNVTVSTVSSSQLNVSWTKNEESNLKHYKVYRNETSGFTPNESSFVANTTPNYYLDSGLKANTTYYYRVTAVNDSWNEGNASEEAWNTTEAELPPTPYIVKYGYVFYENKTKCNGPVVNVTNQAEIWQAETNESYNYYELILDSKNVSADNTLEFNARDTAATQFNTTDHMVTPDEINDGGLFNFNLTLQEEEEENIVDNVTNADISVAGTVSGTHENTHTSNDTYQSITEIESGGKKADRYSYLEHNWTINVTGGTKTNVTFHLEAHNLTGTTDSDAFQFEYWNKSLGNYITMVIVNTSTDANYTYKMPNNISGNVTIRVIDTDQIKGHKDLDTIYIDHMYIRSVLGAPDEIPPSQVKNVTVTTVSSSQLNVSWTKNEELDLKHYNVYRNETQGFTANGSSFVDETTTNYYLDSGLKANTTYYYRVTAVDKSNNKGTASGEASNTTEAELPPAPFIVKYGYVFYDNGDDCDGPVVTVTNTNTNKTWQAETKAGYNYYELILDSYKVSAGHTLEFNARDTAATQFNTTNHIVTQPELDDGGLFNFNITLHPSGGANDTAIAEDTPKGTVIEGSYENTTASDNDYEVIEEVQSGQRSVLEHTWTINVTGGSKVTFHLQANRTDTGNEGDNFEFAYWNETIGDYVLMATVNNSTDFNYTYELPTDTSGNVSIQVVDTNNGNKKIALATIHVDHMYIRSEP